MFTKLTENLNTEAQEAALYSPLEKKYSESMQ